MDPNVDIPVHLANRIFSQLHVLAFVCLPLQFPPFLTEVVIVFHCLAWNRFPVVVYITEYQPTQMPVSPSYSQPWKGHWMHFLFTTFPSIPRFAPKCLQQASKIQGSPESDLNTTKFSPLMSTYVDWPFFKSLEWRTINHPLGQGGRGLPIFLSFWSQLPMVLKTIPLKYHLYTKQTMTDKAKMAQQDVRKVQISGSFQIKFMNNIMNKINKIMKLSFVMECSFKIIFQKSFRKVFYRMKRMQSKANISNFYNNQQQKPYLKISPFRQIKNEDLSRRKNSSSAQALELNKQRMKRLEAAYRQISEKKYRSKSNERLGKKTQNQYYLRIPFKPFQSINMQNRNSTTPNQTKRLFLRSKNNSETGNVMEKDLQNYSQKMQQLMLIKNQKVFVDQFDFFIRQFENKQNDSKNLISFLMKLLDICSTRKLDYLMEKEQLKRCKVEEDKDHLIQNDRKLKQKIVEINFDLRILQDQNQKLELQIEKLRKKDQRDQQIQVSFQTTKESKSTQIGQQFELINSHQSSEMMVKLVKKLRQFEKREKQLLSVLFFLKQDGINIEKAYEEVCREKKNQDFSNESQDQVFERFQSSKGIKKQTIDIKLNNSFDADDSSNFADISVISSFDAISFNYDSKEPEFEKYSPRRVYKCEKEYQPSLRQKLKLNFECIYESESSQRSIHTLPTV